MKTKDILKYIFGFIILCMAAIPVMAQKNIDKVIEDLDKRTDVAINSVVKRDLKTRKITRMVKTYTSNDMRMAGILIRAFEKDEEYTITAIKDMPEGRNSAKNANFTFIFYKDNKKSTYTLSVNEKAFTLTVITRPEGEQKDDISYLFDNGVIFGDIDEWNCQGLTKEQQKQLEKQMEQLRKSLKGKLQGLHISEK